MVNATRLPDYKGYGVVVTEEGKFVAFVITHKIKDSESLITEQVATTQTLEELKRKLDVINQSAIFRRDNAWRRCKVISVIDRPPSAGQSAHVFKVQYDDGNFGFVDSDLLMKDSKSNVEKLLVTSEIDVQIPELQNRKRMILASLEPLILEVPESGTEHQIESSEVVIQKDSQNTGMKSQVPPPRAEERITS